VFSGGCGCGRPAYVFYFRDLKKTTSVCPATGNAVTLYDRRKLRNAAERTAYRFAIDSVLYDNCRFVRVRRTHWKQKPIFLNGTILTVSDDCRNVFLCDLKTQLAKSSSRTFPESRVYSPSIHVLYREVNLMITTWATRRREITARALIFLRIIRFFCEKIHFVIALFNEQLNFTRSSCFVWF